MFKFIHSADIHLDSPLHGLERYEGAPIEHIRGASRQALENLVRISIDEEVAFILMSGDLYDGDWRDYNTGLFLVKEMSKLREAGIKVFVIFGNHDAASQISRSLRMPDNVKFLSTKKPETITLDELGVAIHGQGFPQRVVMDDLAAAYPNPQKGYFNIGLLHTSVTGREGHDPYAPCSVDTLLSKNYDYWALGHVHKREIIHKTPWIVFPGNIQGRHIREIGPKGCMLVTVEDGQCRCLEHADLHVLRWVQCDIDASEADFPEDLIDRVRIRIDEEIGKSDDRFLAVRICFSGPCKAHRELSANTGKWASEIRATVTDTSSGTVWVEKIKINTRSEVDLEQMIKHNDPMGELLRYVQSLESTDELLDSLNDDLTQLKAKLPGEIFQGEDGLNLESREKKREVLEDVKQMLVTRLLSKGGGR